MECRTFGAVTFSGVTLTRKTLSPLWTVSVIGTPSCPRSISLASVASIWASACPSIWLIKSRALSPARSAGPPGNGLVTCSMYVVLSSQSMNIGSIFDT